MREPERTAFEESFGLFADTVYRLCFSYLKNPADTEDAVQETFLKRLSTRKRFTSREHEKAWLLVVAMNTCRDILRRRARHPLVRLEDSAPPVPPPDPEVGALYDGILALPERVKAVVYLYYFEGYSTPELAAMLRRPESTVRNQLAEGRRLLKKRLEAEDDV